MTPNQLTLFGKNKFKQGKDASGRKITTKINGCSEKSETFVISNPEQPKTNTYLKNNNVSQETKVRNGKCAYCPETGWLNQTINLNEFGKSAMNTCDGCHCVIGFHNDRAERKEKLKAIREAMKSYISMKSV